MHDDSKDGSWVTDGTFNMFGKIIFFMSSWSSPVRLIRIFNSNFDVIDGSIFVHFLWNDKRDPVFKVFEISMLNDVLT